MLKACGVLIVKLEPGINPHIYNLSELSIAAMDAPNALIDLYNPDPAIFARPLVPIVAPVPNSPLV